MNYRADIPAASRRLLIIDNVAAYRPRPGGDDLFVCLSSDVASSLEAAGARDVTRMSAFLGDDAADLSELHARYQRELERVFSGGQRSDEDIFLFELLKEKMLMYLSPLMRVRDAFLALRAKEPSREICIEVEDPWVRSALELIMGQRA